MKHQVPDQSLQIFISADSLLQPVRETGLEVGRTRQIYYVIGIMSGSSLDGLDIARVELRAPTAPTDTWQWRLLEAETLSFSNEWQNLLTNVSTLNALDLLEVSVQFGTYLGAQAMKFLSRHPGPAHFVASHGHTVYHQPTERGLTFQMGHGAAIAAAAGLPVVCDFRALDVALGGQGAPLVPLGDRLLFPEYGCCLNLGGIANLSVETTTGRLAYDISACNQLFNMLAAEVGLAYDADGQLARSGKLNSPLLTELDAPEWFEQAPPRSLGREWIERHSLPPLRNRAIPLPDRLHTATCHVAGQVARAIRTSLASAPAGTDRRVLATGGGAFNGFLIECLQAALDEAAIVVVPAPEVVNFKEALIFALLGTLRWRSEINTLASATGARHDSSGGAIYLP